MVVSIARRKLSVVINDNAKKLYKAQESLELLRDAAKAMGLDHLSHSLDSIGLILEGVADDITTANEEELGQ